MRTGKQFVHLFPNLLQSPQHSFLSRHLFAQHKHVFSSSLLCLNCCLITQGCQMLNKEYGMCLSSLWQIFGKIFDTGNVIGNIGLSVRLVFSNAYFSMLFCFWQLNWSSTVKHSTNNYEHASGKLKSDRKDNSQRLMLSCIFSLKFATCIWLIIQNGLFCQYWQSVFQKMANFWQKNISKKVGKLFGKQWFLGIFAKFGTIWLPWDNVLAEVKPWFSRLPPTHIWFSMLTAKSKLVFEIEKLIIGVNAEQYLFRIDVLDRIKFRRRKSFDCILLE